MRILNGIRNSMLKKKQFSRYIVYAFGEIILVVLGILIALWVNRSNEERKLINKTNQVGKLVLKQLDVDIADMDSIQLNWDIERKITDTILRLTKKDEPISKACNYCPDLLTGASIPTLTDRIPKILAGNDLYEGELLEVLTEIEFHYLEGLKMSAFFEQSIIDFTTETLTYWRDRYDWFSDLTSRGRCPDDCITYFYESSDYRNRVAYYELMLLDSYYQEISYFKDRNKAFKERLQALVE